MEASEMLHHQKNVNFLGKQGRVQCIYLLTLAIYLCYKKYNSNLGRESDHEFFVDAPNDDPIQRVVQKTSHITPIGLGRAIFCPNHTLPCIGFGPHPLICRWPTGFNTHSRTSSNSSNVTKSQ